MKLSLGFGALSLSHCRQMATRWPKINTENMNMTSCCCCLCYVLIFFSSLAWIEQFLPLCFSFAIFMSTGFYCWFWMQLLSATSAVQLNNKGQPHFNVIHLLRYHYSRAHATLSKWYSSFMISRAICYGLLPSSETKYHNNIALAFLINFFLFFPSSFCFFPPFDSVWCSLSHRPTLNGS